MKFLCAFLLAVCAISADTSIPTPKELMDRHIQETGGLAELEKAQAQSLSGKLIIPAAGMTGKFQMYLGAHGEMYQIVEMPGAGQVEVGNNGDVEWENSTITGPRVRRLAPKPGALLSPQPFSSTYWQSGFSKMQTAGTADVHGRRCYKVTGELAWGSKVTQYFDAASGLLVQAEFAGPSSQSLVVGLQDYRPVGTIKAAHTIDDRYGADRQTRG